jgi:glucose-1-phosphate cytidylyltransferase
MHYFLHNSDITIDVASNNMQVHGTSTENFKVTLVETGADTKTAGRLKQVQKYIGNEDFMLTYGDGVIDVKIDELLRFHKSHKKIATVTAVQLASRFGGIELSGDGEVVDFKEKAKDENKWINAGFFVLKPGVFTYLEGDMKDVMWEDEPLEALARDKQLVAYKHTGFWKCMDALRDKIELEALWENNQAKWKLW